MFRRSLVDCSCYLGIQQRVTYPSMKYQRWALTLEWLPIGEALIWPIFLFKIRVDLVDTLSCEVFRLT